MGNFSIRQSGRVFGRMCTALAAASALIVTTASPVIAQPSQAGSLSTSVESLAESRKPAVPADDWEQSDATSGTPAAIVENLPEIAPETSLPTVPPPSDVPTRSDGTEPGSQVPTGRGGEARSAPLALKAETLDKPWVPTENPHATVVPGQMRSDREQIPAGFTKADADKAETMEARLDTGDGLRTMAAPGCQVYWPAPYEVCGAIRDKYNALGGPNSFLLFPKTNELTNPDGVGKRTEFVNGPIYWSPQGGAHPVVNHFLAAWARHGYENSYIGYPTTDEIVNPDGIGRRQHFTGSTIYWYLNEAYSIGGEIQKKWNSLGAERGQLGYPISDELVLPDGQGRMNRFQHGVIYWHPSTGAHEVTGPILVMWAAAGYERSPFGYPTGAEGFDQREELTQSFQKKQLNLSAEIKNAGTEIFQGKEISRWLMDQLRLRAKQEGFDLETIFTQSSNADTNRQARAACRTDYPQNPNTGGIEIPGSYCYTGITGDTLHDFCTKSPDEWPSPGANANFRGPCAQHDMCYEANTGNTNEMRTCDSNFRNNLMRVCEGVYTGVIDNARRQPCRGTALGYYSAVVAAHHDNYL